MKRFIVRYKVTPGRAQENQELITRVFAELHSKAPAGVSYTVYKGQDGVSFFHLVSVAAGAGENPISQMPAFKAFQVGIGERCEEPPVLTDLEGEAVGSYGG